MALIDTIVVTRPLAEGRSWTKMLRPFAQRTLHLPSVETAWIAPDKAAVAHLLGTHGQPSPSDVVFVSPKGAMGLQRWLVQTESRLPQNSRLWAVGPTTAKAVEKLFSEACRFYKPFRAETVAFALGQVQPRPKHVWLPRAQDGRETVAEALTAQNISFWAPATYQTKACLRKTDALPKLTSKSVVVFASPSAVEAFFARWPKAQGFVALSLGPVTAQALKRFAGVRVKVAPEASTTGVLRWFENHGP